MTTRYPFDTAYEEIEAAVDGFIDAVFDALQSSFMLLPRGPGFVTYPEFQHAYEVLKRYTSGFTAFEPDTVVSALQEDGLTFIVLRTMLGFTPPELAYVASEKAGFTIPQSFARTLDRQVRVERQVRQLNSSQGRKRVMALVATTCQLLKEGKAKAPSDMIHRLDKADTSSGLASLRHLAHEGVPYAMLLYERFLGRPFAAHRDSVSELVGAVMENAVEEQLRQTGISFRKTARAERVEGFDQAPDFIVPDEVEPPGRHRGQDHRR